MVTVGLPAVDADALELLPPPVEHALTVSASTDAPRASMRNLRIGSSFWCVWDAPRWCVAIGRGVYQPDCDAPMSGIWRELRIGSVARCAHASAAVSRTALDPPRRPGETAMR